MLACTIGHIPRILGRIGFKSSSIPRNDVVQQRTTINMYELTAKREYVES